MNGNLRGVLAGETMKPQHGLELHSSTCDFKLHDPKSAAFLGFFKAPTHIPRPKFLETCQRLRQISC